MLSVPSRAEDDKFTSSIEGYRGSIHKLGRLIAHDWFTVITPNSVTKERYLFLFKARILICKVRRISDDRSVFQLKDIVRLTQVEIKDLADDYAFELIEKKTKNSITFKSHREGIKEFWLKEIREFANDFGQADDTLSPEDFRIASPPSEPESPTPERPNPIIVEDKSKEVECKLQKDEDKPKQVENKPKRVEDKPKQVEQTPKKSEDNPKQVEHKKVSDSKKVEDTVKSSKDNPKNPDDKKVDSKPKENEDKLKEKKQSPTRIPISTNTKKSEKVQKEPTEDQKRKSPSDSVSESKKKAKLEEDDDQGHLKKIQEVEPLVSLHKKRVLEEKIEYTPPGYVEPKGSAIQKLCSVVEPVHVKDTVLADYSVGVEINVEIDDMSRKYTSSTSSKTEAEFSRSTYSVNSDSRYSTADASSKYDELSRKYSRTSRDVDDPSAYRKSTTDDHEFSRRSIKRYEPKGESYTSRRVVTRESIGVSDGENYVRKTRINAAESIGDGENYSMRTASRSYLEDSRDIEGTRKSRNESDDILSKYLRSDSQKDDRDYTKYSRSSSSKVRDEEDGYSKYSRSSAKLENEDDVYSKYTRKYSRSNSKLDDDDDAYSKYTRKYSRSSSKVDDEDNAYAKYTRKYSRSTSRQSDDGQKDDDYEKYQSKYSKRTEEGENYSRKYSRTQSGDNKENLDDDAYLNYKKKYKSDDLEIGSYKRQISSSSTKSVDNEIKEESKVLLSETKSASKETVIETQEKTKTLAQQKTESETITTKSKTEEISASSTATTIMQKTATEKLEELESNETDNDKPRFVKTLRGTNLELSLEERADRAATDKPEFLISLKDTELLEDTYLRFMVKVAGEPNPDITFFKDGVKILDNTPPYEIVSEHSDKGFYELVIPEVKMKDAGVYKCVATNKFGETSCEATVTVTDNKKILEEMPEGEILPPGEKPSFHWKKDGESFEPDERFKVLMGDDEDSLALVFQHVRPDDVGLYTCVAQTSRGHISCSAELTVHGTINQVFREPEKPKLVIEKKNPIVTTGGSAMIELQVKGYPKPQVKWTHENKEIEASEKYKFLYEDDETISLVIKDVKSEDAGKYTVTAINELGSDTGEVNLTVKKPPKINTKLEAQSSHTEQILKMTLEIEGTPKPTLKYYKDGKEIKQSERIKMVEEGEKYSLVIQKTTLNDTGSYSVVAINELAQVSEFWELDVYSKPKILEGLGKSKQIHQNEDLELKIKLEAKPEAEVKWYKDEQEITSNSHYNIKKQGDSYILKITGTVTTDSANYKVKAVNIHGEAEDEVRVDVKKIPKITQGLKDMTVTEHDQNVTFDVKLEAFPKPQVKWYLDETEITETRSEFTRMESDDGVKLVIKEVSTDLSGRYTCKLSNECGEVETTAKLTVNCAPRIIKKLVDTTVEEGAVLHLELEVEACPSPSVKWLRNGREVSADARIKITRDTKRNETYNLDVSLIKYEEQGEYEVYVTNALGTVSSKSFVTVHKITHTDAIEETGEEPKKLKIEIVEESQNNKVQIEEIDDVDDNKGATMQHLTIQDTLRLTIRPLVEEPTTPEFTLNTSEIFIQEYESSKDTEETFTLKKPRKIGSVTIEEVDVTENVIIEEEFSPSFERTISDSKSKVTLIEEEHLYKPLIKQDIINEEFDQSANIKNVTINQPIQLKRGVSYQEENLELKEYEIEPQIIKTEKNPPELKRGISARKESIEIITNDQEKPGDIEIQDLSDNKKLKRAQSLYKEKIEAKDVIENAIQYPEEQDASQKISQKEVAENKQQDIDEPELIDDINNKNKANLLEKQESISRKSDNEPHKAQISKVGPSITDSNMKDGSRPESLAITYIVRGFANPPPTARWTLNNKEILPDRHLRMTTSENGEEFKLEIKKLKMQDAGTYHCILSNPLGEVTQQAVLEVTPEKELRRPKLKEGLIDQTIVKKHSVTHKIVVIGDPIPDISWYFNGKEMNEVDFEKNKIIIESEDHEIQDDLKECTFSLTIPRCERFNQGNYKVRAKNIWDECESSAELTIILKPEIEGPEDVSVVPGEGTEFSVIIQSNPQPDVKWMKDDRVIEASKTVKIVEDAANEKYKLIFKNVQLSDDGYYKVVATNHLGETSSEARLKTKKDTEPTTEKPKFITSLTDDNVEDRGEITAMVRADGLPKPEIKWYFNGEPIAEDNRRSIETHKETQVTSRLTIKDFQEGDIGRYKAVAINCVGEVETTAKLSVLQFAPSFGKKLDRTFEVNEGEPMELKAKISGSPKPTAVWYKNSEPIEDERVKTTILPDGTVKLNIDKCTPEDSGAYKLVVRNANGETACLCAVAVTPNALRPKFIKCFKDQANIPIGETIRLDACVKAHPPPEIKWLKDGVPIRSSAGVHIERHPDGQIALVVDCAKPENAGVYQVVVSNRLGKAMADAKIDVAKKPARPEFIKFLLPQTVVEGFPVKMEVKATGHPEPKITWSRNGVEVVSDNKHIKLTETPEGNSVLLLDAADIARDALTYTAKATNEVGETETSAPLTIQTAVNDNEPEDRPMLLHGLRDAITDEGSSLVFESPFSGNPIPSVEWKKDGEVIVPSDRILMTCDGRKVGLKIDYALPTDAGVYSVALINPLGKDSSQAKATVHKVFMPPTFTQKFMDLQQLPNRDAKFPCKVSGVPQPEVTWSKDGVLLGESDKYHIKRDGDNCCLYVLNCEPEDAGVYRATATNKEGQDDCTATLEVVKEIKAPKRMEPPIFLKRIGDTELYKSMTARFTACASGIPEPEVEWYHNDQKMFPSNRIKMETDRAGLIRLTIAAVDVDDIGKYTCKIFNEHGSDICHANLKFDDSEHKTKRPIVDQYIEYDKYKRSGAPMPLSDPPIISKMTDRHCTLSWNPSIPTGPRFPVTYQLEMCEVPNGDWFTVRSGIRSCTCGVRNLEPFRDYKFRVRVENKYGISDPSPYAITHREKLEPDLPKFKPYLPSGIDFRPDTSPYFPKDFDIERPPIDNMAQAPRFLRQEHDTQYGVKDQNTNLCWFVYGYPKPTMSYYFNDELIEPGGRFDMSYTRNGQATLFINKMLDRDVGWYEAIARNEHGEARQRVRLEIAEIPTFIRRPDIEYVTIRGRAKFEARIIGVPYPEIKWYKDWMPLAASTRIKMTFTEPDLTTLTISDVIMKDEGLYSVSARNVAGCTSSSAMLHAEENDWEYNLRTYNNLSPLKLKRRPHTELYDLGDELGRGTQGITYHAVERINGRNYAAKVMHGRGDLKTFMYNEWETMNQLRHKKLISLHDCYETDDTLALILELGSGGRLVDDYLLKQEHYTESDIAGFVRQILNGLHYMHEKGFGHMGLTLNDLLISHPGGDDLKICDFGLSRRIMAGRWSTLRYGMPEYVSPECANNEGVGFGHDMWSLGIITYILLSGRSPFRGANDMETLTKIRTGKWIFEDEWWTNISYEAKDFITKLLVYRWEERMDVYTAMRHPWLERSDKFYSDEFRISSKYLRDYWKSFQEWYDNANCRNWYRRRPLEGAFTHPSKMVYPPGESYTPRPSPVKERTPKERIPWEDQIPTRSPLNYEIGMIKSESHYQNGPDTYLLQLRDVDFPVRLREYMKVAANRGPGSGYIVSDENGYDWRTPIIRERRRFTDIMDEEIDDERKARINKYGSADNSYTIRRLKNELGSRLDTYVEAEAVIESKQEGRLPFFREKPQFTAMQEGKELELTCLAVGEPQPIVQWFKNDTIMAESHRIKITTDDEGRSHLVFSPALSFDQGMYKVVARNKIGQTITRTRVVIGLVPDEPDSPEVTHFSDTEVLLSWRLPKCDGNSPVLCYRLDYKLSDEMEWTTKAENIDHEFYLIRGLQPKSSYIFRLAAKNAIGWSGVGVPSAPVSTKDEGAEKIQMSKAMQHLQNLTDSGQIVTAEAHRFPDYRIEGKPVDWQKKNAEADYSFISEISRGRFSVVVKAANKETDEIQVAKLLDCSGDQKLDVDGEFAALRSLRHERIASLLAAYKESDNSPAVFILEKLQGADILTYLASRHEYTEQTVTTIVTQILDGLQYLHWRGLCHLDLQPDNIVMCSLRSVQIKLVDLGSAHRVSKLGTKVPTVGHLQYMSPEILSKEPAFPQTDIWTVGVLTYLMLSGKLPFSGEDENETKQNINFVRYRFEYLYTEVSQEATRFLMLLFKRHPNKRPSAEECHENRWLLPTDFMIKKRERAVFLGTRLKEYCDEYHGEKSEHSEMVIKKIGNKFTKSLSIQEELSTAP